MKYPFLFSTKQLPTVIPETVEPPLLCLFCINTLRHFLGNAATGRFLATVKFQSCGGKACLGKTLVIIMPQFSFEEFSKLLQSTQKFQSRSCGKKILNGNPLFSPHQTFIVVISFDFFQGNLCATRIHCQFDRSLLVLDKCQNHY